MRVIAGTAKGRRLVAPKGVGTRPALAQVKEAVFNILGGMSQRKVLDLFAGSGSIGIEALSRGAEQAVFVENAAPALKALRRNLELCGFEDQSTVLAILVKASIQRLARQQAQFDVIFVDPPYDCNLVMPSLRGLEKVLAEGGVLVVESSPREPVTDTDQLQVTDRREYGQTRITFLEKN